MRPAALLAASLLATSLVSACADPAEPDDAEDAVVVADGKADDYFSASAQEYLVSGRSSVTLDPADAAKDAPARLAAAKRLIGEKQIAIAWFMTQYLVDKEDTDPNHAFGGFGGMAKAGAYQDLEISERATAGTFDFTFKQLVAGGKNLIARLPVHASGGAQQFVLDIGKPSNAELGQLVTNEEWYRNAPWSSWDPSKVDAAQKESITFTIARDKLSTDAYFDVARLAADGKIDIDVFFGWDYHDNFHLKHSRAFFGWLKDQGFAPPIASYDDLTRTSGAFTRGLIADGKAVTIEVRMFWGKPGTETDPDTDAGGRVLEDQVRASLKTRDVVLYSGHSGPFYGFALADWRKTNEGDFDDSEMRTADLASKYQIVVAEGCDTYQIGEAFKDNPAKAGKNVDVITTTSFSNAATPATVEDFVTALLAHDSQGRLRPRPVSTLLSKLDANSYGFHSMYGLHGIDDNPALIPFANVAKIGQACSTNASCGGVGNLCVKMGAAGKRCTAACAADRGCPTTYTCKPAASSSTATIFGNVCAK